MPDFPQPYVMRNWSEVALQYDAFIFDREKTGQHLPLVSFRETGVNYPELKPIQLDTYVGTNSAGQAEAINIIPAIVGASLLGIDKSQQDGIDWVEKTKDFFNKKNGQQVYLNGYNSSSGNDWWYDLMPNIFFYQLSTLYTDPDYDDQFVSVADQWLEAVHSMGASTTPWTVPAMNYRGWYLSTMTGNAGGVHEPEAAGAIGWLLYHAWIQTSDEKYLIGAQHALEYLSSLTSNPSYELMLPYGTLAAAKLNATLDTNYDIEKMLNWSFDRGPLRGWGTIVGKWDGKDVSGLIGEANDGGNDYAFLMNGYQQAAALAPVIKYDKRFARAISKWILNLANASRLLYPKFLDETKQDDYAWSNVHDPESVIAYEALKQNWEGKSLYGTGDAKRNNWAETNLGLYGSSHVGYLAAVVKTTNVEGILQLDLNATDFFGDSRHPVFAYFNPHATDQQIIISLGQEQADLYDAISESVIGDNVSGDHGITIKAGEVIVVTVLPSNTVLAEANGIVSTDDGFVVDYHANNDFSPAFRLKSLASQKEAYEFGETANVFATVENSPASVSYQWFVNDEIVPSASSAHFQWTAPSAEGMYEIRVAATSEGESVAGEIQVQVMADVPEAPTIEEITKDAAFVYHGNTVELMCDVASAGNEKLTYEWSIPQGNFEQDDSVVWWTPSAEGLFAVSCKVTNKFSLSSTGEVHVLVKDDEKPEVTSLAYYPLNLNTEDYSGNGFHAQLLGAGEAEDALGNDDFAYRIATTDDIIKVPNSLSLNFVDRITLSCWIRISSTGREAFILSHGSWEERWKISLTPDLKIRWTVKTSGGVKDLDSRDAVQPNVFYHIAVVYSGYSMELYINGELDQYAAHSGSLLSTDNDLTFGQKSAQETQYYLNGIIDEVRIFNDAVQPWQIATLKELWTEETLTPLEESERESLTAYPNPVHDGVVAISFPSYEIKQLRVVRSDGKAGAATFQPSYNATLVNIGDLPFGYHFIEVLTTAGARKYFKLCVLR